MLFDFHLQKKWGNTANQFALNLTMQSTAKHVAVVGASGCGKSMMLYMIAGLIQPDNGYIRLNQQYLFNSSTHINTSPQARCIGLMFQDYALFPHLTVAENIAFGLHSGCLKHRPPAQVAEWLDKMQLQSVAHHYPQQLSGGQKQRTALARTLITQPQYLLLDEPFSALDAPLRIEMRTHLSNLQAASHTPLLLVTHDIADAHALGAEIWQINNGTLQRLPESEKYLI